MLKQRNKKASPQMHKQQEAESRKQFYQHIKWFFTLCGHEELFKLIPLSHLKVLFKLRFRPPVINMKGTFPYWVKNENDLTRKFFIILKSVRIPIPDTENEITAYDYFTIGNIVNIGILHREDDCFDGIIRIKEEMRFLDEFFDLENTKKILSNLLFLINVCFSELNTSHYSLTIAKQPQSDIHEEKFRYWFSLVELKKNLPNEIKTEEGTRPVFRVGWYQNNEYVANFIPSKKLLLNPAEHPPKIPVYIQSHAIARLNERIDIFFPGFVHYQAFLSLLEPNVMISHDGSYLIDYRIEQDKIGYLVGRMVKKKLIIRTFLLSTQSGTPEEKKFRAITRLSRGDIDYLNMTRLGAFIDSGIEENPRLKSIFDEAGLTPILTCVQKLNNKNTHPCVIANKLARYLIIEEPKIDWHEVAETICIEEKNPE